MKLQKRIRVKLTQKNNCSNSVKLDRQRKWQRQWGHLYQVDVVRNAPETLEELDDVFNVCARIGKDHKDSSTKSGRDLSKRDAGEDVHRRDGAFQSRVIVRVPVLRCVCIPVHKVCVCGLD